MKQGSFKLHTCLWVCVFLLLAFAFPLQVLVGSPYPSLLPYLLIFFIWVLSSGNISNTTHHTFVQRNQYNNLDIMIFLYVLVVSFHAVVDLVVFDNSFSSFASSIMNFLFPVVFYFYFQKKGSQRLIDAILTTIAVIGFIVGLHFVWDTIMKISVGEVGSYTQKAFEYTVARHNRELGDASINQYRVLLGARSFGLLEMHSVSGAWIILGLMAALTKVSDQRYVFRRALWLVYGGMLIISMNFTNCIALALIAFFIYGSGWIKKKFFLLKAIKKHFLTFGLLLTILFFIVITEFDFLTYVGDSIHGHINLFFGSNENNYSFFEIIQDQFERWFNYLSEHKYTLLFGDGFSSSGMEKGGDFGWLETLIRFGVPVFFIFSVALGHLLFFSLKRIRTIKTRENGRESIKMIEFSVGVMMLVFINEGHYSIWFVKSILPLVFFVLALLSRYAIMPLDIQTLSL